MAVGALSGTRPARGIAAVVAAVAAGDAAVTLLAPRAVGDDRAAVALCCAGVVAVTWLAAAPLLRGRRFAGAPPAAYALAFAAAAVYLGLGLADPWLREHAHAHPGEVSAFRLWGMLAGALIAVGEEVVFRGWLMDRLARAGRSPRAQVATSALAFGAIHGLFALPAALLGAAFATAYLRGGRRLGAPVAAHVALNLLAFPWYYVALTS